MCSSIIKQSPCFPHSSSVSKFVVSWTLNWLFVHTRFQCTPCLSSPCPFCTFCYIGFAMAKIKRRPKHPLLRRLDYSVRTSIMLLLTRIRIRENDAFLQNQIGILRTLTRCNNDIGTRSTFIKFKSLFMIQCIRNAFVFFN